MTRMVRHGSLRSKVYSQLRENILQGQYQRGTALTEAQIALEMGVSRTPIREAFCQLELDGLVRTTPNKSVVVQGFDDQDILDLYEVRSHMETLAAAKAAVKMTEEQCRSLKAAYEREVIYTQKSDDVETLQSLDSTFHDLIFQGSGSKILQNILSSISIYTRHARSISLGTPGRSQKVLKEHEQILAAILEHNSNLACERMREHIAQASANFKTINRTGGKSND